MTNHLRQSTLDMLNNIDSLPTLPDLFLHIQNVLNDSEASLQDLTKVIEADQATAATIVKIANSSFYNPLGRPVNSLSFAISRLGRSETSRIALSMSLLYGFSMPAGIAKIKNFWAHAFAVGKITRGLTESLHESTLDPELLFLCGLLHDIGKAILGIRIDNRYFEHDFHNLHGNELTNAEAKHYGIDHAEVGSIILKQWGISSEIADLVLTHHKEPQSLASKILNLSDKLAHQYFQDTSSIENVESIFHSDVFTQVLHNLPIQDGFLAS